VEELHAPLQLPPFSVGEWLHGARAARSRSRRTGGTLADADDAGRRTVPTRCGCRTFSSPTAPRRWPACAAGRSR
jgi:hypothetical protein